MASNENTAQERTERATSKRLEEARKRGQVVRSSELNASAVMLAGGTALWLAGSQLANGLCAIMTDSLSSRHLLFLDPDFVVAHCAAAMLSAAWVCAPILGLTFAAAVVAPMTLNGWNVSLGALGFKWERLDILTGLGRMVSLRGFVELGKASAKFLWIGAVAWMLLRNQRAELMHLGEEPVRQAIAHAAQLCARTLLVLGVAIAMIAAIDVPWQMWQYQRELRMSREEVREENKESEGSPEVKHRIRGIQQAMARRRMMSAVPSATVVITNPSHYAVALRYDDQRDRAPIVVAKGADAVAAKIREIAVEHAVPLVEAPPLARALYRHVDIGLEVPAKLYVSVAQILTYVFQLRTSRLHGGSPPSPPQVDPSVEDLLRRKGQL